MGIRIGIDTGGTFTDVVALDELTGRVVTTKTPSTPSDPANGFMNGIEKVLDLIGASSSDISAVSHGTTVATNQLLEDKIESLGFITTHGYEFMLEIARQSVPDGYGNSYFWVKPDRIVPVDLVKTVRGRFSVRGEEIHPFDENEARSVARYFRDRQVKSVAICFLHSYVDATHEERMREILREEYPEVVISISSQVLKEYREYERSMTTLVDAAVKPKVSRYVTNIKNRLDRYTRGQNSERRVPFYVMKSNGGVLSADEVVHQPITTVLSGPAAGALGAAMVSAKAGFARVLTLDGGGTSTDVSVVVNSEPTTTTEGSVGRFPSKIPMIDVVTVGAGGGSIAWITPEGTLKVGPHSAGADPGPMCYEKGGLQPTITDAHLLLGRIPPHLLGGEIPLNREKSESGISRIAAELRLTPIECAQGILEISAWNQANALRQITVKRGLDVRDFYLTTFGGSGSLLLCRLIDILGLAGVIVPQNPGNVSAFGLLTVDVRNDYVQTMVMKDKEFNAKLVGDAFEQLMAEARNALRKEGFLDSEHIFRMSADLRYFGQAFEVRVDAPDGEINRKFADEVVSRFHNSHKSLYGYDFAGDDRQPVEWVNLRVSGIGPIARPQLKAVDEEGNSPQPSGVRDVIFESLQMNTPIYWRPDLSPGFRITGPAVIEEFGSTVPLHPDFELVVDQYLNLIIKKVQA
jgi:N-methylhydantoinase A